MNDWDGIIQWQHTKCFLVTTKLAGVIRLYTFLWFLNCSEAGEYHMYSLRSLINFFNIYFVFIRLFSGDYSLETHQFINIKLQNSVCNSLRVYFLTCSMYLPLDFPLLVKTSTIPTPPSPKKKREKRKEFPAYSDCYGSFMN